MCLDPRPDSLVRPRRSVAQKPTPLPARVAPVPADAVATASAWRRRAETWVPALVDDLDARGWTLVSRVTAAG